MGAGEKRQGPMRLRLATRNGLPAGSENIARSVALSGYRGAKKRGSLTSKNVLERGNGQGQVNHDRKSRQRPHGPAEGMCPPAEWPRAIDAFSTQRAKNEHCCDLLNIDC